MSSIGIDAGGTLVKLAYWQDEEIVTTYFPSARFDLVKEWIITRFENPKICMTGGRAKQLEHFLGSENYQYVVEFDATIQGVMYQLKKSELQTQETIITNIGTGTSIHYLNGNFHERLAGTGIGGGTLLGLSKVLIGTDDFSEIVAKSEQGSRKWIDVRVEDIYQHNELPIKGSLTASNFGALLTADANANSSDDYLAGIQGMIGEVISSLSIQAADTKNCTDIIYIGTTLENNEMLQKVIASYTILKDKNPLFLPQHGFSGAIGALLTI
ncbi:type II pantothenate kinase [Chryseomicrobium sp. FSL W7-1435]|uniref:type II pantothenate kinase n=1 Tax=Chryseomicrobium sp. FSL W7-1435 TaxID=2921704 RepID=UPI00315B3170